MGGVDVGGLWCGRGLGSGRDRVGLGGSGEGWLVEMGGIFQNVRQ